MKNNGIIFLIFFITVFYSCTSNNNTAEKKTERIIGAVPEAETVHRSRFANIQFASKYDTSCGMPLSAGLEDTLHYKNKIYGFCSKECKDEFMAKIKKGK